MADDYQWIRIFFWGKNANAVVLTQDGWHLIFHDESIITRARIIRFKEGPRGVVLLVLDYSNQRIIKKFEIPESGAGSLSAFSHDNKIPRFRFKIELV